MKSPSMPMPMLLLIATLVQSAAMRLRVSSPRMAASASSASVLFVVPQADSVASPFGATSPEPNPSWLAVAPPWFCAEFVVVLCPAAATASPPSVAATQIMSSPARPAAGSTNPAGKSAETRTLVTGR